MDHQARIPGWSVGWLNGVLKKFSMDFFLQLFRIIPVIYCTISTLRSQLVTCYATSSAEQMFTDGCDRVCSSSYCMIFITVVALWLSSVTEYLGCEFNFS